MNRHELERWLVNRNREYSQTGIPHIRRPWDAMRDLSIQSGSSISLGSPICDQVFSWFEKNSPPGSHDIGTVYEGAFFLDSAFWQVRVGLLIGAAQIDPLGSLPTMPHMLKHQLATSKAAYHEYIGYWCDCWDFIYGFEALAQSEGTDDRFWKLVKAGYDELRGAVSLLLSQRTNLKSILSFRLATEIFLKAALVREASCSDKDLLRIGQSIAQAAEACRPYLDETFLVELIGTASHFPSMSSRYESEDRDPALVWKANVQAHRAAAEIMRKYTASNVRAQLERKLALLPDSTWLS